jgi:hypothetical protein
MIITAIGCSLAFGGAAKESDQKLRGHKLRKADE